MTTAGALPPALVYQFVRSPPSASGAEEAIGPATSGEVLLARFLVSEVVLKLPQGFGKRWSWHPLHTTYWGLLSQPDKQKMTTAGEVSHV